MALNIKHAEVERLATIAAQLAHETKTEAIRKALIERIQRLELRAAGPQDARIDAILAQVRAEFPRGDFGRTMTKSEREEILGYGPHGV